MHINRCLIIEDIAANRVWLQKAVMAAFGDQVHCDFAETLREARQCLAINTFDLTLIDIGLPDGSGLSVLDAYEVQLGQKIITTIFDDDDHVFRALQCGVNGYLLKSETIENIVAQLEGIICGRPPISNAIAQKVLQSFHTEPSTKIQALTEREKMVLTELAKGLSVKKIAKQFEISPNTVSGYVKAIYQKLNINNKAQAAAIAQAENLI
mgnify:CR=1 FL=1|jgi:DNA-binding NarL/FixJ family response regulator